MNTPRCTELDLVNFLMASPRACSALEAERVQPASPRQPAHDAFTRLLTRLEPDSLSLWNEVSSLVDRPSGVLVIDDSTLDKPYARCIDLVGYHWSGKHHRVVRGINLISLIWTDGDRMYPCDYRVYDSEDGLSKNDHAIAMLKIAKERGFKPEYVLFDSWYASLDNFKEIRQLGWKFLTRIKSNRKLRIGRGNEIAVEQLLISAQGTLVWLPGFGEAQVFRIVAKNGDKEYWLTNDLAMTALERIGVADNGWQIEVYHRGLKQFCGVERCQCLSARAQRNFIRASLRVFVRLEWERYSTGITWFNSKLEIIRDAVRRYIANPHFVLPFAPTA